MLVLITIVGTLNFLMLALQLLLMHRSHKLELAKLCSLEEVIKIQKTAHQASQHPVFVAKRNLKAMEASNTIN